MYVIIIIVDINPWNTLYHMNMHTTKMGIKCHLRGQRVVQWNNMTLFAAIMPNSIFIYA